MTHPESTGATVLGLGAMAESGGITATDFAARATPFLSAMTFAFAHDAAVIDGGDYTDRTDRVEAHR